MNKPVFNFVYKNELKKLTCKCMFRNTCEHGDACKTQQVPKIKPKCYRRKKDGL
jgi:hypothetical protein